MRLVHGIFITLIVVLLAASCSQKAEPTAELTDGFIYMNFADASAAAGSSGKQLVLDFYTDS